ncbi:1-acyl-sn-glycerol-3-phosphate acyltransferase [Pelomonas sp. KK5]|uniref:lysophospholipid acyltransferase family protein n=1 Tax=Pelomonas sp. KK5 TaxID=1855730 RepID=UPI00097CB122|nr:lysophospholipid acyltransferase family protein [Pelomonas sp. KK5]
MWLESPLGRAWRVLATGLAFAVFGLGGVLLGLFVFPLLQLVLRDPVIRQARSREMVRFTFGRFVALMHRLGLLTYELHGMERLERGGLLILANHPTLIDVVFLVSLVRNADCVVRSGLANNLFTRGPIRASGYIRNEGGPELLDACIASLRQSGNLVIFPEGTRSRPGEALKMQRGAAQVALRAACDITPVRIRCEPPSLTKGLPWWKVPARPMHFTIRVDEDITVARFIADHPDEPALAARHLTAYLQTYFSLQTHAGPTGT